MEVKRRSEAVRVRIIMTQYVHTDAKSFKSVVQRMTGMDALDHGDNVGSVGIPAREVASSYRERKEVSMSSTSTTAYCHAAWPSTVGSGDECLSERWVGEDFEKLLDAVPAWDELLRLCSK